MKEKKTDLLQGTLDLLVLKALALNRDRHLIRAGVKKLRYAGEKNFIHLIRRTPTWRTWLGITLGILALAAIASSAGFC